MKTWRRFLAAVSFLTRVPLPAAVLLDEDALAESPPAFPVVGALIGVAVAGFDRLACTVFPSLVVAVADLTVVFLLTGGLHLDGLLDSADGLFSGKPRERTLEIMKDSRVGAMGVSAGILLVGLKVAAISSLTGVARVQALFLAPVFGRYALAVGISAFPYARTGGGLGSLFQSRTSGEWTALSGLLALALGAAVAGAHGATAFAVAVALTFGVGGWVSRRLGGLTGDIYGALCELAEAAVYLVFTARW